MDTDTLQGITRCPLFKGLTDHEIIELMHTIRYRVIRFHKGDIFSVAGTPCLHADIIISGEMTAHLVGPTGRMFRMTTHGAGSILAPAFLFAKDNLYPVTVEAVANTQVLRFQERDMHLLLEADPRLMMNYIRLLSDIVAGLTKKVGMLSLNIREKITVYLRELQHQQQSAVVSLPMSRMELASHFGIQKYSLQRCLNELQEAGAIRLDGRRIHILSL